jgi:hypothetical protein
MPWAAIILAGVTAFWLYVTFHDARWVADNEGPAVWGYAFFGVCMSVISGVLTVILFLVWWF